MLKVGDKDDVSGRHIDHVAMRAVTDLSPRIDALLTYSV
jgi:hypothetical protein